MALNLDVTAIRSVTFYYDGVGTSCDRCGTGIKNVFAVGYKDGEIQKYGSECINKILDNQPSLRTLFNKNAKLLKKYQEYLAILTGPVENMPRGGEYYGSGQYFIGNGKTGKEAGDIFFTTHWYFHPVIDVERNAASDRNIARHGLTPEAVYAKNVKEIEADLPKLKAEIARLEAFLAKIMRASGKMQPN